MILNCIAFIEIETKVFLPLEIFDICIIIGSQLLQVDSQIANFGLLTQTLFNFTHFVRGVCVSIVCV